MSRLLRNCLILLALNAWVIVYLRTLPPVESTFRWKRTTLERHRANCDVLVLGSSHALYGIRPDQLSPQAINMALVSQDTHYDWEMLKKWGPDLPELRVVVEVISPKRLYFELDNSFEEWRSDFYLAELGLPPSHWTLGRRLKSVFPRLAFDDTVLLQNPRMITEFQRCKSDDGWCRKPSEPITPEAAKVTLNRHGMDGVRPAAISEEVIAQIRNISQWCREHQVTYVLVNPPHHHWYRDQADQKRLKQCLDRVRQIGQSEASLWIDEFDSTDYVDADFHDPDHLSELGATKLSERIGELIKPYL